jgi:predicted negative regulator of RcsB-dependent stress response
VASEEQGAEQAGNDKPLTPGQRLAAAKAAKAAEKAKKRGRDAEIVEGKAVKQAEAAAEWAQKNRSLIWGGLALLAVSVAAVVGWSIYSGQQAHEASELLLDAVTAARGEIREGGNAATDQDEEDEVFESTEARAEASLERFRKVLGQYEGSQAGHWARLGEAKALADLGKQDEARASYEKALLEGGDDPMIALRALEGIAFTYEQEEKWDEAIERFQRLGNSGGAAIKDIADYNLGRVYMAKGDMVQAKDILHSLWERLRSDERTGPELPFIQNQTELRLMEIDPSLLPQRSLGGGGGQQPSQQEIQEMIRQLQLQQGGAGGGLPFGGPGGAAPSAPGEGGGEE